jgi:hypothetical protein
MTTMGQLLAKLAQLTEEQQRQVLAYIEHLQGEATKPLFDPYGMCADLRTDLPFEEFKKNRQEMWGNATEMEL